MPHPHLLTKDHNLKNIIEKFKDVCNFKQLESLAKHGIVSLCEVEQKEKGLSVNYVVGTQRIQGSVCLNHIELKSRTVQEIRDAIRIAVYEEYTGILGISLERGFPLLKTTGALTKKEIADRLSANIVFVLKPPTFKTHAPVVLFDSSTRISRIRTAYSATDGLSQSRAELVTGGKVASDRICEIKTDNTFDWSQVLKVLVPESLMEAASSAFSEHASKLISVEDVDATITKIPSILTIFHKEHTEGSLLLSVPNYERVLLDTIVPRYSNFCLHAVRLNTIFDVAVRYAENLSTSADTIKAANSSVAAKDPLGGGWFLLHQAALIDTKLMQERMKEAGASRLDVYNKDLDLSRANILACKGDSVMRRIGIELTDNQLLGLKRLNVSVVDCGDFLMLGVPESLAKKKNLLGEASTIGEQLKLQSVTTLLKLFRVRQARQHTKRESAAVAIQTHYRGYVARTNYSSLVESSSKVKALEEELAKARIEVQIARKKLVR